MKVTPRQWTLLGAVKQLQVDWVTAWHESLWDSADCTKEMLAFEKAGLVLRPDTDSGCLPWELADAGRELVAAGAASIRLPATDEALLRDVANPDLQVFQGSDGDSYVRGHAYPDANRKVTARVDVLSAAGIIELGEAPVRHGARPAWRLTEFGRQILALIGPATCGKCGTDQPAKFGYCPGCDTRRDR